MKVISLWQPYATLAVNGHKLHETRPYCPPSTIKLGDRFAIAATKQIKREQRAAAAHPRLRRCYRNICLSHWMELPLGCIVGTVVLDCAFVITNTAIEALDEQEYVFGDWREGRWAWLLRDPIAFEKPIPVRGQQGIWNYDGNIPQS